MLSGIHSMRFFVFFFRVCPVLAGFDIMSMLFLFGMVRCSMEHCVVVKRSVGVNLRKKLNHDKLTIFSPSVQYCVCSWAASIPVARAVCRRVFDYVFRCSFFPAEQRFGV